MRMLITALVAAGLIAGCASKPAEPPVTKRVKVDASNIAEAQKAGYKVVNQNGKELYCKKEFLTGSRLNSKTTCLTASEWTQLNESSGKVVRDMGRTVQTN